MNIARTAPHIATLLLAALPALGLANATPATAPSPTPAAASKGMAPAPGAKALVAWRDWSDDVFAQARAQKKYILLDVGAVWCHWCHVMDATTYRDPKVAALIRKHFIPVRVDQDARPDLSRRYEDFGWPATIVLNADGQDIGKMRGYREPRRFARQLNAILKDPSPLFTFADDDLAASFNNPTNLSDRARQELLKGHRDALDTVVGGRRQFQRFLTRDSLEYALAMAQRGDSGAAGWVRLTLDNARALIDPAWGGMYQYSTHEDWKHPHYEKIMEVQANALLLYSQAYRQFGDARHLQAAQEIRRYVKAFLTSPEGAFYTSQDADRVPGEQGDAYFGLGDAERRARGIPRVDTHVYARENGWMIDALVELYTATGDSSVLDEALAAARWVVAHRAHPDGGFRHDAGDASAAFFGDSLAMGRAMLSLYMATGDATWLQRAQQARADMARFAAHNGAGYLPTPQNPGTRLAPRPNLDENIDAARFGNLLARYSGDEKDRAFGQLALRYLSHDDVATRFKVASGILLASEEAANDPLHITVIGPQADARSRALLQAALAQAGAYRRVEFWDPARGPLTNPDVSYPSMDQPAAYVCTNSSCSLPLYEAKDIRSQIALASAISR